MKVIICRNVSPTVGMVNEKRRLFAFFDRRQEILDNIHWQMLLILLFVFLLAATIVLICERCKSLKHSSNEEETVQCR